MAKRGKLIVFDAIDGAGKTTQIKLLLKRLRREKKKYYFTSFPQYEKSFFGRMVRQYLNGEFGNAKQTNAYLISVLYALDRFEARDRMRARLNAGTLIVSDRYAPANKIHQACKIRDPRKKTAFLKWLDEMEFKVLGIPKPDRVLFLDVPPRITRKLVLARGRRDMHELDLKHQQQAYRESLSLVKRYPHWRRVRCVERGRLLAPEEIHNRVWKELRRLV